MVTPSCSPRAPLSELSGNVGDGITAPRSGKTTPRSGKTTPRSGKATPRSGRTPAAQFLASAAELGDIARELATVDATALAGVQDLLNDSKDEAQDLLNLAEDVFPETRAAQDSSWNETRWLTPRGQRDPRKALELLAAVSPAAGQSLFGEGAGPDDAGGVPDLERLLKEDLQCLDELSCEALPSAVAPPALGQTAAAAPARAARGKATQPVKGVAAKSGAVKPEPDSPWLFAGGVAGKKLKAARGVDAARKSESAPKSHKPAAAASHATMATAPKTGLTPRSTSVATTPAVKAPLLSLDTVASSPSPVPREAQDTDHGSASGPSLAVEMPVPASSDKKVPESKLPRYTPRSAEVRKEKEVVLNFSAAKRGPSGSAPAAAVGSTVTEPASQTPATPRSLIPRLSFGSVASSSAGGAASATSPAAAAPPMVTPKAILSESKIPKPTSKMPATATTTPVTETTTSAHEPAETPDSQISSLKRTMRNFRRQAAQVREDMATACSPTPDTTASADDGAQLVGTPAVSSMAVMTTTPKSAHTSRRPPSVPPLGLSRSSEESRGVVDGRVTPRAVVSHSTAPSAVANIPITPASIREHRHSSSGANAAGLSGTSLHLDTDQENKDQNAVLAADAAAVSTAAEVAPAASSSPNAPTPTKSPATSGASRSPASKTPKTSPVTTTTTFITHHLDDCKMSPELDKISPSWICPGTDGADGGKPAEAPPTTTLCGSFSSPATPSSGEGSEVDSETGEMQGPVSSIDAMIVNGPFPHAELEEEKSEASKSERDKSPQILKVPPLALGALLGGGSSSAVGVAARESQSNADDTAGEDQDAAAVKNSNASVDVDKELEHMQENIISALASIGNCTPRTSVGAGGVRQIGDTDIFSPTKLYLQREKEMREKDQRDKHNKSMSSPASTLSDSPPPLSSALKSLREKLESPLISPRRTPPKPLPVNLSVSTRAPVEEMVLRQRAGEKEIQTVVKEPAADEDQRDFSSQERVVAGELQTAQTAHPEWSRAWLRHAFGGLVVAVVAGLAGLAVMSAQSSPAAKLIAQSGEAVVMDMPKPSAPVLSRAGEYLEPARRPVWVTPTPNAWHSDAMFPVFEREAQIHQPPQASEASPAAQVDGDTL